MNTTPLKCQCAKCRSLAVLDIEEGDIVRGEDGSIVPVPADAMWCEACEMVVAVVAKEAA